MTTPIQHVVQFSFGIGSWATAKLVARRHGTEHLTLLFADVKMEDEDTYRWGREAAANVGGRLVEIADGRDPWQVFFDERYLGNTRADPCSKILKRELCDRYMEKHFDPAHCIRYVGIHWSESDRYRRVAARLPGWNVQAPLCEKPLMAYNEQHAWAAREGLKPQRLYELGFAHSNCGASCVKAGQASWRLLLRTFPERYAYHERREQELRDYLGKDVSILRDRRGGVTKPWTLRAFREHLEARGECDPFDWGACGCFSGELEQEAPGSLPMVQETR